MSFDASNPEHLQQALAELQGQLATLQRQQQSLAEPITTRQREPKIAMPEKFNGDRRNYREFMSNVRTIFRLKPSTYDTDEKKIGFIGTLLTKQALTWYRIREENQISMDNYEVFVAAFQTAFSDPNRKRNAQRAIRNLRQGNQSTLAYSTKFSELAMDAEYDNEAKMSSFYDGLNFDVKDALSLIVDLPEDYAAYVALAIRLDNRLYERRIEKRSNLRPQKPHETGSYQRNHSQAQPTPMDVDTTKTYKPLTNEEKQRRKENGLCLYCGNAGHQAVTCPNKRLKVRKMDVVEKPKNFSRE